MAISIKIIFTRWKGCVSLLNVMICDVKTECN